MVCLPRTRKDTPQEYRQAWIRQSFCFLALELKVHQVKVSTLHLGSEDIGEDIGVEKLACVDVSGYFLVSSGFFGFFFWEC